MNGSRIWQIKNLPNTFDVFFLLLVFLQLFLFSQVPEIIIQEERSVEQIKVSCCKKASNLKAKMGVSPGRSVMR